MVVNTAARARLDYQLAQKKKIRKTSTFETNFKVANGQGVSSIPVVYHERKGTSSNLIVVQEGYIEVLSNSPAAKLLELIPPCKAIDVFPSLDEGGYHVAFRTHIAGVSEYMWIPSLPAYLTLSF